MSILFGHYVADAGSIEVDGRPLPPGQPRAALAAGIGMVHQHFTLADNLSVLDNVMLGTEPLWRPFSRRAAARAQAARRWRRASACTVDPDARVGDLSVGERQRVEILKALADRGRARILILDEPTAVLTPQESESLFATLRQMVAAGPVDHLHQPQARRGAARRRTASRCCAPAGWWPTLPAAGADAAGRAMVGRRDGARAPPRVAPATRSAAATHVRAARRPARWPRRRSAGAARRRDRRASPASPATARRRWPTLLCGTRRPTPARCCSTGRALPPAPARLGRRRRRPHSRGPPRRRRGRRPAAVGERGARALRTPRLSRAGLIRRGAATRPCGGHRRALRRARRPGSTRRRARCRAATCRS